MPNELSQTAYMGCYIRQWFNFYVGNNQWDNNSLVSLLDSYSTTINEQFHTSKLKPLAEVLTKSLEKRIWHNVSGSFSAW